MTKILKKMIMCLMIGCMITGVLDTNKENKTIMASEIKEEAYMISDTVTGILDKTGTLTISGTGPIDKEICFMTKQDDFIKKVIVEEGITSIGDCAFFYLGNLEEVELPKTVVEIGNQAFFRCLELKKVKGYGVKTIKSLAFQWCSAMVEFPDFPNIENIEGCSFTSTQIKTVTVPNKLKYLELSAFDDCLEAYEVSDDNQYYSAFEGVLFNKDRTTLIHYPPSKQGDSYLFPWETNAIGDYAFYENKYLERLEIPNSVQSLGYRFAANCENLYSVTIFADDRALPVYGFSGCKKLKFVSLSNEIELFHKSTFEGCDSLEKKFENEYYYDGIYYYNKNEGLVLDDMETYITLEYGETYELPLYAKTSDNSYLLLDYAVYGTSVDFQFDGKIKAVSEGTSTVQLFQNSEELVLLEVTVKPKPEVEFQTVYCVNVGEKCLLNKKGLLNDYSVGYSTLEKDGLEFERNNGELYLIAKKAGTYFVSINHDDTVSDFKVIAGTQIRTFTFDQDVVYVNKGNTKQLQLNTEPFTANESIDFYTYDPDIVTVDSKGNVKANKGGKATVVAQTTSGLSQTCKVIVPYTIKYNLNGGINHKDNPTSYWNEKISLKSPSRAGYIFQGWYSDKSFTKRVTSFRLKDRTVYAKWKKISLSKPKDLKVKVNSKTSATVSCKKQDGVTGYQFIYSTRSDLKNGKKVNSKASHIKIDKLKKGTYYVRVRSYKVDSTGKRVYSTYSTIKKIKL